MEVKNQMEEKNMSVISMKQLLEAGVHFGRNLHYRFTEICR